MDKPNESNQNPSTKPPEGRTNSQTAFTPLAMRYLDGVHTEEEARQLAEQLAANPTYRDLFAALSVEMGILSEMSLAADNKAPRLDALPEMRGSPMIAPLLLDNMSNPLAADGEASQGAGFSFSIMRLPGMTLLVPLLMITLMVGALFGWLIRNQQVPMAGRAADGTPLDREFAYAPAAHLTSTVACSFGEELPQLQTVGGAVNPGDSITLYEGIADFRLASGVYLSVEGPSSLVIASPSSFVLLHGKVTANVPWTVTNFKAIAAACQFTACDAEFALWHEGSKLETHVFQGEVRAAAPFVPTNLELVKESDSGEVTTSETGVFARAAITAGHALLLEVEGDDLKVTGTGIKANPEMFATKLPMAGGLPVSPAYVDAVMASKPIGYWRFNAANGSIANEIKGGASLEIFGQFRLTGSGSNYAAEFQPNTESYLLSSKPLDSLAAGDYTIETWIKPSHVHFGRFLSLVSGDETTHPCTSSLELQPPLSAGRGSRSKIARTKPGGPRYAPGTVRFVHNNPASGKPLFDTSCFSKERYRVRRWQHISAVKEGPQMRLYVDGRLAATAREETPLTPGIQLRLGWDKLNEGRNFVGQLDEVAVYDRALSREEVERHYQAMSWDPKRVASEWPGEI